MSNLLYKVGDILINDLNQFTKIISLKNGKYGLSGWSARSSAEQSNVARQYLNIHGLQSANLRVVSSASKVKSAPDNTLGKTAKEIAAEKKALKEAEKKAKAEAKALAKANKK